MLFTSHIYIYIYYYYYFIYIYIYINKMDLSKTKFYDLVENNSIEDTYNYLLSFFTVKKPLKGGNPVEISLKELNELSSNDQYKLVTDKLNEALNVKQTELDDLQQSNNSYFDLKTNYQRLLKEGSRGNTTDLEQLRQEKYTIKKALEAGEQGDTIADLNTQLAQQGQDYQDALNILGRQDAALSRLEIKHRELLDQLQAELRGHKKLQQIHAAERDALRQELTTSRREVESLRSQIQAFSQEGQDNTSAITQLEEALAAERGALQQALEELIRQEKQLTEFAERIQAEASAAVEEANAARTKDINELHALYEQQLAALQAENDDLHATHEKQFAALQAENDDLRATNEDLEASRATQAKEFAALQDEQAEQIAALKAENEALQAENEALQAAAQQAKQFVALQEDYDAKAKELDDLHAAYAAKTKELDELEATHADQIDELATAHAEQFTELQKKYASQVADLQATYEEELNALRAAHAKQIAELEAAYASEFADLQTDDQQLQASRAALRASHTEELNALRAEYAEQIATLQTENKQLQDSLAALQAEQELIQNLELQIARLSTERDMALDELRNTVEQMSELDSTYKQKLLVTQQYKKTIEQLNDITTKYEALIKDMMSSITKLERKPSGNSDIGILNQIKDIFVSAQRESGQTQDEIIQNGVEAFLDYVDEIATP